MTTSTARKAPTPPKPTTDRFTAGSVPRVRTAATATKNTSTTMLTIIAQAAPEVVSGITGNIASAFGLLGAAIGVGLIGNKAAEAVGRNPGASGKILVQAIIGMALAEGLGILALFLAK